MTDQPRSLSAMATPVISQQDGPRITTPAKARKVVSVAEREAKRRLAGRALAKARTDLAAPGEADVLLGTNGSKWRHGYIPLNPAAVALKLKKTRGHGGGRRVLKSRVEVHTVPGGKARAKSRPSAPGLADSAMAPKRASAGRRDTGGAPKIKAPTHALPTSSRYSTPEPKAPKAPTHALPTSSRYSTPEPKRKPSFGETRPARYSIRESTYRGQSGHIVSGTDAQGRHPKVFTSHGREDAVQVKANMLAGKEPFAHHTKESRMTGQQAAGHTAPNSIQPTPRAASKESMLPGTREHLGVKYIVKEKGASPMAPSDAYPVETMRGAHVGHFRVKDGKLHIGKSGNDYYGIKALPEHEVKNVKQGIAGLHASHTLVEQEHAEQKAAKEAEAKAITESFHARRKAEQDAKDAAQREKDIKSTAYAVARDEARRRYFADVPKGIKPTVTKSDTAAKVKARAALAEQLSRAPVDLHSADVRTLKPGQAVTFTEHKGQGIASETHTGHVLHVDSGLVAVHTDKATFSTSHSKGRVGYGGLHRHDAASGKEFVARDQARPAKTNLESGVYGARGSKQFKSYAEAVRHADAEFKKRMAAKKAKVAV